MQTKNSFPKEKIGNKRKRCSGSLLIEVVDENDYPSPGKIIWTLVEMDEEVYNDPPHVVLAPIGMTWPPKAIKTLVKSMYQQVLRGKLLSTKASDKMWMKIGDEIASATSVRFKVSQITTKRDRLRQEWKRYKDLINKDMGLSYDKHTGFFTASEEVWRRFEADPGLHALRIKPFKYYEELSVIFCHNTTTGSKARSSTQKPCRRKRVEDSEDESDEMNMSSLVSKNSRAASLYSSRRKKASDIDHDLMQSFIKVNEDISTQLNVPYSCERAFKALKEIPGLESAFVYRAMNLLASEPPRRSFLLLKTQKAQKEFLVEHIGNPGNTQIPLPSSTRI